MFRSQGLGITSGFQWDSGFPTNWDHPPFIDPSFGLKNSSKKSFEFSTGEPQPRPKIATQRIFYLPPALDFIRWEVAAAGGPSRA